MIISKIQASKYIYYNLHAEQVITSNYFEDSNSGVYEDRLSISTILRIIENINENKNKDISIILDFDRIVECQANSSDKFIELKKTGIDIIALNISAVLVAYLGFEMIQNIDNMKNENGIYERFYFFEHNSDLKSISINPLDIFKSEFKEKLKQYKDEYREPHSSSYVYLSTYIDLKKFISYEKEFSFYAIYMLALQIRKTWGNELINNPILVCLSMNSSYMVSILSSLLKLDVLIFDKIGPINKLYSKPNKIISNEKQYIIVSDLVCLGTEVKIVKNLIQFIGAKCLGNVSLIKIETLKSKDIEKENVTTAVFSINRKNNKELGYTIFTNLETIDNE